MDETNLIKSIMTREVVSVSMDETLERVRAVFEADRFHHLIVTEHGLPVGVLSDRDVLKCLSPYVGTMGEARRDAATLKKRVHQMMSRRLVPVTPETPVPRACELMLSEGVTCLPVLDEDRRCVGIVTWRDLLRWCVAGACGLQERDAA